MVDALVVNPYDADELAKAIDTAIIMSPEEKKARMQRLRAQIREYNVYRWAGSLISELAGIRLETAETTQAVSAVVTPGGDDGRNHSMYAETAVK